MSLADTIIYHEKNPHQMGHFAPEHSKIEKE
jgi:hypothetical protein